MEPVARMRNAETASSSADQMSDPAPPNIRNEWNCPVAAFSRALAWVVRIGARNVRVIHEQWAAADVALRNHAPVTAVLGAVAVVAHHEIVIGWNDDRSPVVE